MRKIPPSAGGDNGGEDSSPLDPLEAYSAEELREMVRLAAADKENILRRAENEIRKARDFALQTFASGICEVRDGLGGGDGRQGKKRRRVRGRFAHPAQVVRGNGKKRHSSRLSRHRSDF